MTTFNTDPSFKIDNYPVNGLLGTQDSLAYHAAEIERHLHARERWFGKASSPSGTTHAADRIGPGITPFVLDAGNNTWGEWTLLFGSGDTPYFSGSAYFDPRQGIVTAIEHINTVYFLQFGGGSNSDNIISTEAYTESVVQLTATVPRGLPVPIQSRRVAAGTLVWGRCLAYGQNTGTISFYVGLHEYEG